MNMLLTVSEDRTTLRSDLSAGTGVSGKGDARCKFNIMFALANLLLADRPCLAA